MSRAGLVWICLAVAAPGCFGQHPIPESERWATITHPGNEPFVNNAGVPLGRVDHEFQISRTEVTGSEWFEFVQAYAPFVDPHFSTLTMFTSPSIDPFGPGGYTLNPAAANRGIQMGWWFAARYCNWLHNDKAFTREAFENGAYDTSTFGYVEGYGYTDQVAHHSDAKYWIPTLDEWIKSSHFDPNRYGEGKPGYWTYSTMSEEEPVGGPPELGGQTSAGFIWQLNGLVPPEVAGYRDVMSPWGLWDVSGGVREWTESVSFDDPPMPGRFLRIVEGSSASGDPFVDRVDIASGVLLPTSISGLRLARAVPGPCAGVFLCALHFVSRRRRVNLVQASVYCDHRIVSHAQSVSTAL